ncbi:hypothetical protein [Actinomadura rudentiformis]|uniref:hypothetical protein n=1 Tax=Actinomadura rudentiformis TaxID=359158 RepID=UPI00124D85AF|nr:hypothetical protein [Actinomadura rudentiformis]
MDLVEQAAAGAGMQRLAPPADPDARLWYRLRTGQQAAFPLWQQLGATLHRFLTEPTLELADRAVQLQEGYSVLFLYIGSCTPEQYEATARPRLQACHPSFTAEWAADYPTVSVALRRLHKLDRTTETDRIITAYQISQQVHFAIAQRLVPDGASLLQRSGRLPGLGPNQSEQDLYDRFFWVKRAPICGRTWLAQTVRRLTQIICDLAHHELRPPSIPPLQPHRHHQQIARIETDAIGIIRGIIHTLADPGTPRPGPSTRGLPRYGCR